MTAPCETNPRSTASRSMTPATSWRRAFCHGVVPAGKQRQIHAACGRGNVVSAAARGKLVERLVMEEKREER